MPRLDYDPDKFYLEPCPECDGRGCQECNQHGGHLYPIK